MNETGSEETTDPAAAESGMLPLAHAVWGRYGELSPLAPSGGLVAKIRRMERQAAVGASLSMEIIGRWGRRGELATAGQGGLPYLRGVRPIAGGSAPGTASLAEPAQVSLPKLSPVSRKTGPASLNSGQAIPGGAHEAGYSPGSVAAGGSLDSFPRVSLASSRPVDGTDLPLKAHGVLARSSVPLSPEAGRAPGQPAHTATPLKGLAAGREGASPKVAIGAVADRSSLAPVLRRIPVGGKCPHAPEDAPAVRRKVTVTQLPAGSELSSHVLHEAPSAAAKPVADCLAGIPGEAGGEPQVGAPGRPAEPWYRSKAGTQPYLIRKLSVTVQEAPDSSRSATPPTGVSGLGVTLRSAGPDVPWRENGHGDIPLSTPLHRGRSVVLAAGPGTPPASTAGVPRVPRRAAMAFAQAHRHDPPRESAPVSPGTGAAPAVSGSPVAPLLPLVRRAAAPAPVSGQAGSSLMAVVGSSRTGAGSGPGAAAHAASPVGQGGPADRALLAPGPAGQGTGGELGPPAGTTLAGSELERLADRVYALIEQRLTIEKESRGL